MNGIGAVGADANAALLEGLTPGHLADDGAFEVMMAALERGEQRAERVFQRMVEGQHYGLRRGPEGSGEAVVLLWLAGAKMLNRAFGVVVDVVACDQALGDGVDSPHITWRVRCAARWAAGGQVVGDAVEAVCSSWEPRFRYMRAWRACPECKRESVVHKRDNEGWVCWRKLGGCGVEYPERDPQIAEQEIRIVERTDPMAVSNGIFAKAAARAYTAATLGMIGTARFTVPAACDEEEAGSRESTAEFAALKPGGADALEDEGGGPDGATRVLEISTGESLVHADEDANPPGPVGDTSASGTSGGETDDPFATGDGETHTGSLEIVPEPAAGPDRFAEPGAAGARNSRKTANRHERAADRESRVHELVAREGIQGDVEPLVQADVAATSPVARVAGPAEVAPDPPPHGLPEDRGAEAQNSHYGEIVELLARQWHDGEELVELVDRMQVLPKGGDQKLTPGAVQVMDEAAAGRFLAGLRSLLATENDVVGEILERVRGRSWPEGRLAMVAAAAGLAGVRVELAATVRGLTQEQAERLLEGLKKAADDRAA